MCLSGWGERWRQVLPWLLGSGMDKARGHLAWGFLRSKWTSEQENQSTLVSALPKFCGFEALKIILCYLSHITGLMLKLKLQYFGQLIQTTYSLEKTPMLGKIEGRRRRG